jgi:8-oxo-dGTP pyrophosphatase MutT (NUDIX family)
MLDFKKKLIQSINTTLPGIDAQYKMAPTNRKKTIELIEEQNTYKLSAVLVVLYFNKNINDWCIPLIKRVNNGGTHGGQIGLPGGAFESEDVTLKNTAIRECYEEIGISDFEVVGKLTEVFIPVSKFKVEPHIAISANNTLYYKIQHSEIEQIIELPLSLLLNNAIVKQDEIKIGNNLKNKTPYFDVKGFKVWGATAMILSEFKEILNSIY